MSNHKKIQEELKELLNSNMQLPKNDGFKLPKNYFEQMQKEVFDKMETAPTNVAKPGFRNWLAGLLTIKPKFVFACFALLACLSVGYMFVQNTTPSACNELACLSYNDLEAYLDQNVVDFEEEVLATLDYTDTDSYNFLLDETVEDYLLDNFDANELLNEL